jgi:DNA-binding response OmpR family regulator
MTQAYPGRFTRAAVHSDAGEAELRLSQQGSWRLHLRCDGDQDWRLACSGDLRTGAFVPDPMPVEEPLLLRNLLLDREARRVTLDGIEVKLSIRQYELLVVLASRPEHVFTKAELMREAWGAEHLRTSRTLENHASKLRSNLRRAGAEGFVVTCHGVGYKLWEGHELGIAAGSTP